MGNKETEQAAITQVLALERAAGREPRDVRAAGLPYDVESPPRLIEVKAFSRSARGEPLPLEERQVRAAQVDPEHYYLYVVDNVAAGGGAGAGVRIVHGEALMAMIDRTRPQITYWPTFRTAEYDEAERLR